MIYNLLNKFPIHCNSTQNNTRALHFIQCCTFKRCHAKTQTLPTLMLLLFDADIKINLLKSHRIDADDFLITISESILRPGKICNRPMKVYDCFYRLFYIPQPTVWVWMCVCGSFFSVFNVCLGIRFLFSIIQSIHKHSACLTQVLVRAFSQRPDNDGLSSILSGHLCIYNMNRNNTHITFNEIDLDSFFAVASSVTFWSCAHIHWLHIHTMSEIGCYFFMPSLDCLLKIVFPFYYWAARNASLKIECFQFDGLRGTFRDTIKR